MAYFNKLSLTERISGIKKKKNPVPASITYQYVSFYFKCL